ncbi:MAG: cytochrome c-type biogenesis protein CcmH [Gammaproteobacteria bacterium]
MKRLLLLVVALAVPFGAFAIDGDISFDSPAQEARYDRLTKELRCVVCQNQNIADSNADLAKDLRGQVLEMLKAGKTDEEILEFMTARYGDFVLYRPPLKPTTWLLWGAPMILLLIGILGMIMVISRRSREAADSEPEQVAGESS